MTIFRGTVAALCLSLSLAPGNLAPAALAPGALERGTLAPGTLAPVQGDLRARFEALDAVQGAGRDEPAIVKLWQEHPDEVLGTIDAYLEGSLAKQEQEPASDPAVVAALEARALRGARAADAAFGTAIFVDYAASFASWSAEEQVRFRQGQALFGEATKALRTNEFEFALEPALASLELARPLGDWWGTAMALGALGRAHLGLAQHAAALECASQARLLNHDLRLAKAEAACLDTLVQAAEALGRKERALHAAEAGQALALRLGDATAGKSFEAAIARLRGK
jgi:hypothetical protein